jgi:sugar lactone lactonase YvrE
MKAGLLGLVVVSLSVAPQVLAAGDTYRFEVVASGLARPVGIALDGSSDLYFSEVPNPAVPGAGNGVSHLDLDTGVITRISNGEPEPTNIAVARNGDVYWTCKSAGVILRHLEDTGMTEPFATGLNQPSGISVGRRGAVYFTEIPAPGVGGGPNTVSVLRGNHKLVISMGEPEPTDVVVARNGDLYWTCKTAGVILRRSKGTTSLFKSGLESPSGIAIDHQNAVLYFTEVPTPGVSGDDGGRNRVRALTLATGRLRTIHSGDPEPTDVAVARNGNVYWTCTSAGVIVEATRVRTHLRRFVHHGPAGPEPEGPAAQAVSDSIPRRDALLSSAGLVLAGH